MKHRAQVSIFLLIGAFLLMVVLVISSLGIFDRSSHGSLRPAGDRELFREYLQACIGDAVREAKAVKSLANLTGIQEHLWSKVPACLDSGLFADKGYDVSGELTDIMIESTNESIFIGITMPVRFQDQISGAQIDLDNFEVMIDRSNRYRLPFDSAGNIADDQVFMSSDGDLKIEVSKGTSITDSDGQPISPEYLETKLNDLSGMDPISMIGGSLYDISPHGIHIEPPLRISIRYPEGYLQSLGSSFTLSYYDDGSGWVDVPTEIDISNDALVGEFRYLP
jgi:hypothetical protein